MVNISDINRHALEEEAHERVREVSKLMPFIQVSKPLYKEIKKACKWRQLR